MKYAKAADLPSYPSQGGVKLSSAGAAASLANNNQKAFEHWKPGALPAAEKAAFLAKDYQADPLWQPELSKAGSKAALLAAQDGGNVQIWLPSESEHGQSAAGLAVNMKSTSPVVDKKVPMDAHRKALLAATGAMSGSRRRSDSAPPKQSDLDVPWALKAATTSHRATTRTTTQAQAAPEMSDPAVEASRIHHIAKSNVNRNMYTANPPVSIEVEEKNRQDTLRASAVAMARKMYALQQTAIDEARNEKTSHLGDSRTAATASHNRRLSTSSVGTVESTTSYPQYTNLQEAATRLAQERLAKLENEHKAYRDYYGQSTPSRSKLSRHLRRRASSDGQLDRVDEEQSRKIRSQMSLFKSRVEEVDERKRQKDREALMAAAQKKVTASMSAMDEKVFNDTGKASPAMMKQWEEQARRRAEADSAVRMENFGKVDVGGGKYLDQTAVEAVARSRLQPTFDDITEKAEAQRARDEELRLDQEEKKRKTEQEKFREADLKAALKDAKGKFYVATKHARANPEFAEKEKQEEQTKKAEEKRHHEQEKLEEKARKAEEKQLAKDQKRKSRDAKSRSLSGILGLGSASKDEGEEEEGAEQGKPHEPLSAMEPASASSIGEGHTNPDTEIISRDLSSKKDEETPVPAAAVHDPTGASPSTKESLPPPSRQTEAPPSPSKKSWFSRHFKRGSKSRTANEAGSFGVTGIGGRRTSASSSSSDGDSRTESSIRDVALAGRSTVTKGKEKEPESSKSDNDMYAASETKMPVPTNANATTTGTTRSRSPSISSLSSSASSTNVKEENTTTPSKASEASRRHSLRITDAIKSRLHRKKDGDNNIAKDKENTSSSDDENDKFEEARSGSIASARSDLQHSAYLEATTAASTAKHAVAGSGTGTGTGAGGSKFSEEL